MIFKGKGQAGFTLIEILVALALVSVILMMVAGSSFSSRANLDELLANIERTVRFSADESSLKNHFVRIKFELDGDEQRIRLQYNDDENLVIDEKKEQADKERDEDEKKKVSDGFVSVDDFDEDEIRIPIGVRIVGIGTGLSKKFMLEGDAHLYFYPTGEKDSAIIILATDDEVGYLVVEPFRQVIERNYVPIDFDPNADDFATRTMEMATDIFKEWLAN